MSEEGIANEYLDQILLISVYIKSKSSPMILFSKRAMMYPGPAPLPEIFLAELLGDNIKVHAVELHVGGDKVLKELKTSPQPG